MTNTAKTPVEIKAYYTTEREIEFLDKIGTYNEHSAKLSKADILRGYLKGLESRVRWGSLSKRKVINHATKLLESEVEINLMII